jgi:hypothetical protein
MTYTGECLCRAVQYEYRGNFERTRACHCSKCRKAFGAAGAAMAFINPHDFSWTSGEDKLSYYEAGEGFGVKFCSICSSKICAVHGVDVGGIMLGSLNGNPNIKLSEHIYVGSKASWDEIGGDVPQFNEGPPTRD